jgi:hypothetical protein
MFSYLEKAKVQEIKHANVRLPEPGSAEGYIFRDKTLETVLRNNILARQSGNR